METPVPILLGMLNLASERSIVESMNFEETAKSVSSILASRGFEQVRDVDGYQWDGRCCRVQLSAPPEADWHYPYLIVFRFFERIRGGSERMLLPQGHSVPGERDATPERLALIVEEQLNRAF